MMPEPGYHHRLCWRSWF